MATAEFDLIANYFASQPLSRQDVSLSIGDDCAIVKAQHRLAITTDTMVEYSHFYPNISPFDLGYKAVATNLSDLAAMGAKPAWISLALTLVKADLHWLAEFSKGMFSLLNQHQVALIGGDTTQGKMCCITITAQGILSDYALCRHQAQVGDWIYVSGNLGDGLAGFYLLQAQQQGRVDPFNPDEHYLVQRNLRPTPRIELGMILAEHRLANAAIDLSDGLVGDLGHIIERSRGVGTPISAVLNLEDLPLSPALVNVYGRSLGERIALQGGEDYELCFTVNDQQKAQLDRYIRHLNVPCTCIGRIIPEQENPIQFQRDGKWVDLQIASFEHFNET